MQQAAFHRMSKFDTTEKDMWSPLAFLQMQYSFHIMLMAFDLVGKHCYSFFAILFSFPSMWRRLKCWVFLLILLWSISLWNLMRMSYCQLTVIKSRAQTKRTHLCIDKGFLPFELLSEVWPIVATALAMSSDWKCLCSFQGALSAFSLGLCY